MKDVVRELLEELASALPPVLAGSSLDGLTGGAINWRTIQNKRSRREIPEECFIRSGSRVLVRRDPFLEWWSSTLSEARSMPGGHRPKEVA